MACAAENATVLVQRLKIRQLTADLEGSREREEAHARAKTAAEKHLRDITHKYAQERADLQPKLVKSEAREMEYSVR